MLEIFKAMLSADSEENGIIDLSVNTYLLICPVKISVLNKVIDILDLAMVQETVRLCCVSVLRCYTKPETPPPLALL